MKILLSTFFLILTLDSLVAQDKIQVVTKTIARSFAIDDGESLTVRGEKAEIRIRQWNRSEVKLTLRLMAKHPSRRVAEKDLSALRYRIDTDFSEKVIQNFFRIANGAGRLSSNLQAHYELWVPVGCALRVQNRYGNVYLSDLEADVDVTASFGEVHLNQVRGTLALRVDYGDVIGDTVSGAVSGVIRKSNLTLHHLTGKLSLESSYGEVYVSAREQLQELIVDASRTEVTFAATNPASYHYRLSTSYSEIHTALPGQWEDGGVLNSKRTFTSYHPELPPVIIRTSFSPIILNQLTNEPTIQSAARRRP